MSSTLTVRLDEDTETELRALTKTGMSRNAVVREAIHAIYQQQVLERLKEESRALLADEEDVAEMKQVQQEMEELRAW